MSPAGMIFQELKNLTPIRVVSDPEVPTNIKTDPINVIYELFHLN